MKSAFSLLVLCVLVASCRQLSPDRPRSVREPAYIRFLATPPNYGPLLDAPDTVAAGVPFTVTVRTYGGGCIDRGDTEVGVAGQTVEVRPFDVFQTDLPDNYYCPSVLVFYTHTASVRLDHSAVVTLRAIGRVMPGDSTTAIERSVVVR
jgi:hypothetical protein